MTGLQLISADTMRKMFYALNFVGGVLLAVASAASIALPFRFPSETTPYSFMGGIVLLPPSVAYTYLECRAFHRKDRTLERRLGWVCMGMAAFALFVTVSAALAAPGDEPVTKYWVGAVGLTITLYLSLCGWERVRQRSKDRQA